MNQVRDSYRVSVDTGGTFTDTVVSYGGELATVGKAPTTSDRMSRGIKASIENAAENLGVELDALLGQTDRLVFGTTHAANALVERKAAKTALIVTKGFADLLLFREGGRPDELLFEYNVDFPSPYIPRHHTFEIDERVSAEGEVVRPLDEDEVVSVLRTLKQRGFEAIAVCGIWSVVNPDHEAKIGELIERELPGVPYTLSHRLLPIVREYRRASAAAIDASLKPMVQGSLGDLEDELRGWGYSGSILVSTSAGGLVSISQAAERPIYLLKSGPAMAPVGGRAFAAEEDAGGDVIVCDTGGTTFDVGLVRSGEIVFTRDTWFGPAGIGELVATATVDIRSIGSGGGSIAHVDSGGLLRVGPESAGANPGPACYGAGGTDPTVTDAALILGYLQPDYFLGGRMSLDLDAARAAVGKLAQELGYGLEQTAAGILTLSNESMIDAISELTLNVGLDPRENLLVAGGGAAGLNIVPIAREMGIDKVLVPRAAGALSASGMQFSDIAFEHGSGLVTRSSSLERAAVNEALAEVEVELDAFVAMAEDNSGVSWQKEFRAEARYAGQVWEIPFDLPGSRITDDAAEAALVNAFHDAHRKIFAYADESRDVEFLNWIGRVTGELHRYAGTPREDTEAATPQPVATRSAWFRGDAINTPVYEDGSMTPGATIVGPAIITAAASTLVLDPGSSAEVTRNDNYLVTIVEDRIQGEG